MNPIDISSIVLISITLFAAVVDGYLLYNFFSQRTTVESRRNRKE